MTSDASPEGIGKQDRESHTGWRARPLALVLAVFGSVGATATLCYFFLASLLAGLAGLDAVVSSIIAYLVSTVFSYLGHKHLSFGSTRAHSVALPRFAVTSAVGLAVACLIPKSASALGLAPILAYASVCLVVPAFNFIAFSRWVFEGHS